jgi:dihydrofolate reductase
MRKLRYSVECSLDGFIARENHSYDFLLSEGEHVDDFIKSLYHYDIALMGRKTYEIGLEAGVINSSLSLQQYVVSNTLVQTIDPRIKILSGDVAKVIQSLKEEGGKDILLSGGAELAFALLQKQLIDEISLRIHPVIIGSGIPVFSKISRDVRLRAYSHKQYNNGIILTSYYIAYH